jgi:chromosome segregation ATPase
MAKEQSRTPDVDLDRTDRLPILAGASFDADVEDDAVPMDRTAMLQGPTLLPGSGAQPEFVRSSGVDLPSLAESVRTVEERIARQNAEYESLSRAYTRAQDSEAASTARANALAVDLAAARSALETELGRSRELDRALADRSGAIESARSRIEDALRESERYQSEARLLRDALAARDAAAAEALRSLGERDAQLAALHAEHAKVLPALEATSKSTTQLSAELQTERERSNTMSMELRSHQESLAAAKAELRRAESETAAARTELAAAKSLASSHLELLRTREWRRGFDHNVFREMEERVGAAHAGHGALESERDRLRAEVAALTSQLASESSTADSEQTRLTTELMARDQALADALKRAGADAQRVAELQDALQLRQAEQDTQMAQLRSEQAAQIARLQSEAETRDEEMAVLMAHLQEARRPIQSIEADVKRLTDELAAKTNALAELDEANRTLQGTLERTRGQLEEREFLIRRLERSESNNANVLGRIQTSIERLGSAQVAAGAGVVPPPAADWSAELIRIDGDQPVTHVLSRRTRIGRAAGCELHIDSGSVSRNHAMVLVGPREAIIEDLNSTNGVLVNGRKISRQPLADGDAVTIGEVQFRYMVRPLPRPSEPNLDDTTR